MKELIRQAIHNYPIFKNEVKMLQRHLETRDNAGVCVPWPYDYHNLPRIIQHSFVPYLQNELEHLDSIITPH